MVLLLQEQSCLLLSRYPSLSPAIYPSLSLKGKNFLSEKPMLRLHLASSASPQPVLRLCSAGAPRASSSASAFTLPSLSPSQFQTTKLAALPSLSLSTSDDQTSAFCLFSLNFASASASASASALPPPLLSSSSEAEGHEAVPARTPRHHRVPHQHRPCLPQPLHRSGHVIRCFLVVGYLADADLGQVLFEQPVEIDDPIGFRVALRMDSVEALRLASAGAPTLLRQCSTSQQLRLRLFAPSPRLQQLCLCCRQQLRLRPHSSLHLCCASPRQRSAATTGPDPSGPPLLFAPPPLRQQLHPHSSLHLCCASPRRRSAATADPDPPGPPLPSAF